MARINSQYSQGLRPLFYQSSPKFYYRHNIMFQKIFGGDKHLARIPFKTSDTKRIILANLWRGFGENYSLFNQYLRKPFVAVSKEIIFSSFKSFSALSILLFPTSSPSIASSSLSDFQVRPGDYKGHWK
jgi:hypothetical protein